MTFKALREALRGGERVEQHRLSYDARAMTPKDADKLGIPYFDRTHVWTLSTEQVDSYRTVIRVAGWNLDTRYRSNPVVLFNHGFSMANPQVDMPIGRAVATWTDRRKSIGPRFRGAIQFADSIELARDVHRLVKDGFLRGASVGFYNEEFRELGDDVIELSRNTLFENSIVGLPANAGSLVDRSMLDLTKEELNHHRRQYGLHAYMKAMRIAAEEQADLSHSAGSDASTIDKVYSGNVNRLYSPVETYAATNPNRDTEEQKMKEELQEVRDLMHGLVRTINRNHEELFQRLADMSTRTVEADTAEGRVAEGQVVSPETEIDETPKNVRQFVDAPEANHDNGQDSSDDEDIYDDGNRAFVRLV